MANTFAPFGFVEAYRLGGAPTEQPDRRYILPANTTPIYFGDPVTASGGYIQQAVAGTGIIVGIFAGCSYNSVSMKKPFWSRAWLGLTSDVSGTTGFDVQAYVVTDPLMVFKVQSQQTTIGTPAGTPPYTAGLVGANINFTYANAPAGQPSSLVGTSAASVDITTATTATTTLPFRIVDFIRDPPGAPGTDNTSQYAMLYVAFNNQAYKQLTGI